MGSFPTRTFQNNDVTAMTEAMRSENHSHKNQRKTRILPSIHISTPTRRRRAAFIKPEKSQSTKYVDKNMLWIYWTPKRTVSWPNVDKLESSRKEQF